ncbi:MAG TPA: hypothetical protein VNM90_29060 [Haliangium sp.]|nr:hypothetical protein [Haliangium sp.]
MTAVLALATAACHDSAFAERAGALASPPAASPYSIEIFDEMGLPATTYHHRGRAYVLGHSGERYIVRVTNPTPRRVEAVISIDGLDAVDGEPADVRKRGYVIQPYGELRVEGFRVSTAEVASFRFSSVGNSYAGRKGKARNVGVIGVAIFAEQDAPAMPLGQVVPEWQNYREYDARDRGAPRSGAPHAETAPGGAAQGAPAPSAAERSDAAKAGRAEASASRRMPTMDDEVAGAPADPACCAPPPSARPGLGTEFGEYRYSAVTWTQFVRTHPTRPSAVLELRYNDVAGLQALGIRLMEADDVITRETAVPFPGDPHFARPPY